MCVDKDKRKESDVLDRPIITDNLDSSSWNDKCDYIEIDNCKDLNPNNYNLVVVQLNIRSLLLKQLELKRLLRDLEVRKSKADCTIPVPVIVLYLYTVSIVPSFTSRV